jgi:SHS2 domain-containing protein
VATQPAPWAARDLAEAYVELEHPADLFLEVRGKSLTLLMEHALYALYDHLVELAGVRLIERRDASADGDTPADALRTMLAEALYLFDAEGFVAGTAEVSVTDAAEQGEETRCAVTAALWGETLDRDRHSLLNEIKAVTYHRLEVCEAPEGWRATVLLDV